MGGAEQRRTCPPTKAYEFQKLEHWLLGLPCMQDKLPATSSIKSITVSTTGPRQVTRNRIHGRTLVGRIAQLVEQLTLNQHVRGSSPRAPSNKIKGLFLPVDRAEF